MKGTVKKVLCVLSCVAMIMSLISKNQNVYAAMPEYEIYPKPQQINYQNNDFILRQKTNVVYSDEIDSYSKTRLEEVLILRN